MIYYPRLTAPSKENPAYYSNKNPYVAAGYGLPNCTCYAYGRWIELGVKNIELSTGDGKTFYPHKDSYKRTKNPELGAIICWGSNRQNPYGHVAVVEQIHSDGTITVSQSDAITPVIFETKRIKKNFDMYGLPFQGYIINPLNFNPEPPKYKKKKRFPFFMFKKKSQ